MLIFIISLEQSSDRRCRIFRRLNELGLEAEIFPAVNGNEISDFGGIYNGRLRRLCYGKDLSAGEIGCAQSHLKVCQEVVKRELDAALILEDDAVLHDELPAAIEAIMQARASWDVVRFLAKPKDLARMAKIADIGGGRALSRIYGTPGGAYGYIVNRRAAERLTKCAERIWMPIDTLHGQTWLHRLRVRAFTPSPVWPDMGTDSTIGHGRFDKGITLDGWERGVYPLTRTTFKAFDLIAKNTSFWLGRVGDKLFSPNPARDSHEVTHGPLRD